MRHTRSRRKGMLGSIRMLAVSIVTVVFLILGSSALAIGGFLDEFDEFEVFIEINATDGDAGLQGKLDGDAWKLATVKWSIRSVVRNWEASPRGRLRNAPRIRPAAWKVATVKWSIRYAAMTSADLPRAAGPAVGVRR